MKDAAIMVTTIGLILALVGPVEDAVPCVGSGLLLFVVGYCAESLRERRSNKDQA